MTMLGASPELEKATTECPVRIQRRKSRRDAGATKTLEHSQECCATKTDAAEMLTPGQAGAQQAAPLPRNQVRGSIWRRRVRAVGHGFVGLGNCANFGR